MDINPFVLVKALLVVCILGYGLFLVFITKEEQLINVEASLIEAYEETYSTYSQGTHKTKTKANFKYQYTFQGKEYTSSRYMHVSANAALGVAHFKGSPKGTKFNLYVHPTFPSYAVVKKEPPYFFIYALVLTGFFGLLNCIFESWLTRMLNARVIKNKASVDKVRGYFKLTGASTAIGIFISAILFFFSV